MPSIPSIEAVPRAMRRPRESLTQILQIVEKWGDVETSELVWSVLQFEGVGSSPEGMTMEQFEAHLKANAIGYVMSWDELLRFAALVQKTFSCTIVGAESVFELTAARLCNELPRCAAVLRKQTGDHWRLSSRVARGEEAGEGEGFVDGSVSRVSESVG